MPIDERNYYCKVPADEVRARAFDFLTSVSKLPDVSAAEIVDDPRFADLFEPPVSRRRRMLEVSQMLEADGWRSTRRRALYYKPDGTYANNVNTRWFPPTETE
jgi:hypothetical protein